MKRISGVFLTVCFAVMILAAGLIPLPVRAAGGSISLSVSSSSVNIGDNITVTVNGSADEEALIQVNVSCSGGAEFTGSGNSGAILEPSAGGSDSATLTYRATSPGTVTFSASVVQAYSVETAEPLSVGDASASVTVKNEAGGGGTGGGGNEGGGGTGGSSNGGNTAKSADNSLRSLSISPGTLSPAFKYSTVNYTASVAADVTSVAVDAKVSNAKAKVESVTGNTDLKPGNNTVKIVVKAENGTVATYTIVVNRGEAPSEEPEEPEAEEPTEAPQGDITVGGRSYKVSAAFPEGFQLPEGFEKATATYGGEEVEVYNFFYGNLKLYYLAEAVPEGTEQKHDGCYFYDEGAAAFFPYISIPVGESYVVVLPTSYNAEGLVPEGYEAAEVVMGENTMDGLRLSSLYASGAEGAGDFYLVYGVNKNGTPGWYQYDSVEGSLQRYVQLMSLEQPQEEETKPQPAFDEEQYKREYQKLLEEYQEQKGRAQIMMFALLAVIVVAVIILVVLLVSGRGKRGKGGTEEDQDIDFIDLDDL